MKYCQNCGAQNQDENYVCNQCKTPFTTIGIHPKQQSGKITNTLINIFGIVNGIASIIFGIITFSKSTISSEVEFLLLDEMGSAGAAMLQFFSAPATIFSFAMGSLLMVFGLFVVLYFGNKLTQKR